MENYFYDWTSSSSPIRYHFAYYVLSVPIIDSSKGISKRKVKDLGEGRDKSSLRSKLWGQISHLIAKLSIKSVVGSEIQSRAAIGKCYE